MRPLAIAVVGGLSVSMLLTAFVVPSAYVVFNQLGERLRCWLTGCGNRGRLCSSARRTGRRGATRHRGRERRRLMTATQQPFR